MATLDCPYHCQGETGSDARACQYAQFDPGLWDHKNQPLAPVTCEVSPVEHLLQLERFGNITMFLHYYIWHTRNMQSRALRLLAGESMTPNSYNAWVTYRLDLRPLRSCTLLPHWAPLQHNCSVPFRCPTLFQDTNGQSAFQKQGQSRRSCAGHPTIQRRDRLSQRTGRPRISSQRIHWWSERMPEAGASRTRTLRVTTQCP